MRLLLTALIVSACAFGQTPPLEFLNHGRPVLDAHNCYPYEGRFADRIDRALKQRFPVGIEQDVAWYGGRAVVSHTAKTVGSEPTLREHFFEHVRPLIEKALRENRRSEWPIIIVHFDFKDNQEPLLRQVWSLLGEYEGWITTAVKGADPSKLAAFDPKPLLVLTEDSDAQEKVFFDEVPLGGKLRLFGSAHTMMPRGDSKDERERLAVATAPEVLLPGKPTNYRRWWNNSWHEVEEGGQQVAGEWTVADAARLKALVDHAHRQGYWIRFYTLDGFAAGEDKGWGNNYNFGARAAVEKRWKAALDAGVDLIAVDQYEEFGAFRRGVKP